MKILSALINKLFPQLEYTPDQLEILDNDAQSITESVITLADDNKNLEELSRLTSSLHSFMLGTEADRVMNTSLYSLDEYVDIMLKKANGETVDVRYLKELRKDLLKRRKH